jgi:hypothetical protein
MVVVVMSPFLNWRRVANSPSWSFKLLWMRAASTRATSRATPLTHPRATVFSLFFIMLFLLAFFHFHFHFFTPLSQTRPHSSSSCLCRRACASLQISGREQGECRRSRHVRVPQPLLSNVFCNCTSCFSSTFICTIPCFRIDGWTPLFCACTRPSLLSPGHFWPWLRTSSGPFHAYPSLKGRQLQCDEKDISRARG